MTFAHAPRRLRLSCGAAIGIAAFFFMASSVGAEIQSGHFEVFNVRVGWASNVVDNGGGVYSGATATDSGGQIIDLHFSQTIGKEFCNFGFQTDWSGSQTVFNGTKSSRGGSGGYATSIFDCILGQALTTDENPTVRAREFNDEKIRIVFVCIKKKGTTTPC